ncbi:MAG: hypothetical protein V7L29_31855 [Nostoc sp.]
MPFRLTTTPCLRNGEQAASIANVKEKIAITLRVPVGIAPMLSQCVFV